MPTTATVRVRLPGPLREARFVERPNRFVLHCALPAARATSGAASGPAPAGASGARPDAGAVVRVHMADPGRLRELLVPGRRVWVRHAASPTRTTQWSAVLVEAPDGGGLVSVDSTLPNRLIRSALRAEALEELRGWALERSEATIGGSRFDFLLRRGERRLVLEVKSVTLVEDGVARFPDAVTARGARHVRELADIAAMPGWEAAVLFVLQRPDAHRIEAARAIDPAFADALAAAGEAGVRVLGRRCTVSLDGVTMGDAVPAAPG